MRSLTQSLRHPGPLRIYLDPTDQMMQHLEPRLPRVRDRHQDHLAVLVALAGCYQSDLVRVDKFSVVDMWSPDEDHVWGALDEGCNSTCHSKAWGICRR